jgi:methionyl-tRNA formyltransferase
MTSQQNQSLTIGYFADGIWSHNAFKLLVKDSSITIAFVCVRFDSTDTILRNLAAHHSIEVITHKNVNAPEFIAQIEKYNCNLFVSMSFNQIFRSAILKVPHYGIINCHAGKLPFYRGRNILNWVLINDEKEFGITVHFVDTGIDTGDIILQKIFPITDVDTYETLLQVAHEQCANLLYKAILCFKTNQVSRIQQYNIHPVGMYCGMRTVGDEIINWQTTSRELFNFIRAICPPGPAAQTHLNGKLMKIKSAQLIDQAPSYKGVCGQVLNKTMAGFVVKTLDTSILISSYEYDGQVKIGDRFTTAS